LTIALDNGNASFLVFLPATISNIAAGGTANFTVTLNLSALVYETSYTGTVTVSGSNGISASFSVSFTVRIPFYTVADALAYLATDAAGSGTNDNPVPLKLSVNLSDTTGGWAALMDGLASKGKFVELYLSACTMNGGTELNTAAGTYGGKSKVVSLTLPNAAQTIVPVGTAGGSSPADSVADEFAFRYFENLKEVRGAGITKIPDYAFYELKNNLTTVNFPKAQTIGLCAFAKCNALTTVSFPAVTGSTESIGIGQYAFTECSALTTLTAANFPNAETIGNRAFAGCIALTTVSFPKATQIGDSAFADCIALTMVTFNATITITGNAFNGCKALTTVNFPEATDIGPTAFYGCTSLTTATFPKVTAIGDRAFANTGPTPLTITMGSTAPNELDEGIFAFNSNPEGSNTDENTATKNVTVLVPSGAVGNYNATWQANFKSGSTISLTIRTN
jgi:hypothetical protein